MKRYTQRSAGFTLVELLVVITIIGMLMALLLPAVNAAVEMARAVSCKNNMRNLAIAARAFEGNQGRFPGYREYIENRAGGYNFGPPDGGTSGQGFSWVVPLLPHLDQNDWYNEFATGATKGRYSELFVCPSDPPTSTSEATNSYIINAAYWYGEANGEGMPTGSGARENPADGVAHNYAFSPAEPNTGPSTNTEYISAGDGTAYTVLLSENVQDSEWYWGGKTLVASGTAQRVPAVFVWHDNEADTGKIVSFRQINGRGSVDGSLLDIVVTSSNPLAYANVFRPSSFHTGQVHISFCDARTIVLAEGIDYVVYQQLMTCIGRESHMGNKNHVLSDNDYR
jgi:prepilin-type N-terminal cleavage/methylation domain-containing protein